MADDARLPLHRVRNAIARRAAGFGRCPTPTPPEATGLVSDLRGWLRRVRDLIGLESDGRDRNRVLVSLPSGHTVHASLLLSRSDLDRYNSITHTPSTLPEIKRQPQG